MFVPVTSLAAAAPLSGLAVLAIDLGFSGSRLTCGVAYRAQGSQRVVRECLRFGECVEFSAKTLAGISEAVLIIEAPLSAAFDAAGNPQARGAFETDPKPRWWSIGPGAAMALAAQYFLLALNRAAAGKTTHHLIEGFVTGADSDDDAEVAARLVESVASPQKAAWHPPAGSRVVSILDWLEPAQVHSIPVVLMPGRR